jgi:hypothetical protein
MKGIPQQVILRSMFKQDRALLSDGITIQNSGRNEMTALSKEACGLETLSTEDLIEQRKRITASMSKEDWKNMMDQVTGWADKRANDEYVRQQMERYKQSDRYKEYLKRKQSEQNNETEKQNQ